MFRLNRWVYLFVGVVVALAIFIDAYSYIYRLTTGQSLSGPLKNDQAPNLFGYNLFLHKGLDLQGGSEVVVQICNGPDDPPGSTCRSGRPSSVSLSDAQQSTITILDQRVNGLGVSEATVQAKGDNQVVVELPGVPLAQAEQVIGTTAKLHFATAVPGDANPSDPNFIADQQNLYDPCQLPAPYTRTTGCSNVPNPGGAYFPGYHWKIDNAIDASDVTSAQAVYNTGSAGQTPGWVVDITFDDKGGAEWNKITTAANAVYSTQGANAPQAHVAIFLDTDVISAPYVQSPSSTQTEISGLSSDQAQTLAKQVSAGALKAEITTVSTSEVSATLGSDTVRRSIIAGAVGLIIVVLFMIGYYRFPGFLASVALLAYALIVLAMYKVLGVTVTLAGLAGFVLSVGMAVDANVLIFERTRDELRHGKSVPLSVETGFRRAFPAIRDSNVSTIIACLVLFYLGSSVVKGFALTLGIGVAVSFFSAMTITQTLFALALRRPNTRRAELYTEIHPEYEQNPPPGRFDIVRNRNIFFGISVATIVIGLVAIVAFGFNLGLDFRGGDRIDVTLRNSPGQTAVAATVNAIPGANNAKVQQGSGGQYTITSDPSSSAWLPLAESALDKSYGIQRDPATGRALISSQQVGPTIASDLVRTSIILVLASSLFIALYLAFAFSKQRQISPFRFSVCTFFKLLHDVFVLAGIWALLGKLFPDTIQVDTLFVTAMLTSVSFSIHDTIVVFDRIRENLRVGPRLTFEQIVNLSTVQTMTRSLNTALTVTFVLLSLVLFGGSTIRGFVLALLIGIVTGTYSSIFNASTLLVAWNDWRRPAQGTLPPGTRRVQARAA